jgi:glutamyl-tRNA reductase
LPPSDFDMKLQLQALILSHRNAPIELREKVAFSRHTTKGFLQKMREVLGCNEAVVISTCNRTEIYFGHDIASDQVLRLLCVERGFDFEEMEGAFQQLTPSQATEHLYEVSLGLDSRVLGDLQIINQVKQAYQASADQNMAGPYLHRLMHTIFFANKRVVQETNFRDGSASAASVSVDLIKALSSHVQSPRILLIGLGEIGQNVLENLSDNFTDITLVNRTAVRAEQLAGEKGYRAARFEDLNLEIEKADVILTAVQTNAPIIDRNTLKPSLTHKLFIDLSVPRAVDISVEEIPGVLLYNVDQIEEKTSEVLKKREAAKADVKAIMHESLAEFKTWAREMQVSPTIQLLKKRLEDIRQEELARYLKKLSPKEMELVDEVTKNMIQKVIKLPVLELKAACQRGEADQLVEILHDLFNLEKTPAEGTDKV